MNPALKKVIATISSLLILWIAYVGSYVPFKKSSLFIGAVKDLSVIRYWEDFVQIIGVPLSYASPIGQEELVRNTGSIVLNVIRGGGKDNPELVAKGIDFMEAQYEPILKRGKGMSFTQNLFVMGSLNETAYAQTVDKKYLQAAEKYMTWGLELSPNRPQFLFGLLNVSLAQGNNERAMEIQKKILELWPESRVTLPTENAAE